MEDWSKEALKELIKKYKKQNVLWDLTNVNYTKRRLREKLEEKIASELHSLRPNTSKEDVRNKFRVLRGQFLIEEQNIAETGQESDWWCFKRLEFLKSDENIQNKSNSAKSKEASESDNEADEPNLDKVFKRLMKRKRRRPWVNDIKREQHRAEKIFKTPDEPDNPTEPDVCKSKQDSMKIQRKHQKAYDAIKLAQQFAIKYSPNQKASKNLTFGNFIADELDSIENQQLLYDTKWNIQRLIREAQNQQIAMQRVEVIKLPTNHVGDAMTTMTASSSSILELVVLPEEGTGEKGESNGIQNVYEFEPSVPLQLGLDSSLIDAIMEDSREC